MRCFISIDLPSEIKKEVGKIQKKLPPFSGKITEEDNLHLTLKFLGEIDRRKVEEVKNRLKKIQFNSFNVEIDFIGVFDNRKSQTYSRSLIVWLHLKNCDELQKKIDECLQGIFKKEKRFMSHLTIARVKSVKDKISFVNELKRIKVPAVKFRVDSFELKKSVLGSSGLIYETLGKILLN